MDRDQIELVIFDCDGVLVDSETIVCRVLAEMVTELGKPLDLATAIDTFSGGTLAGDVIWIENYLGKEVPDTFRAEFRERSVALLGREVQPVAGIVPILKSLKVAKCIGSNGPRLKMQTTLATTGVEAYFKPEHVFSAYDIERFKPDPGLFLHAASRMGYAPELCLVIEDSPVGAQAAQAAGMACMGFASHKPIAAFVEHGAVAYASMAEIERALRTHGLLREV